MCLLASQCVGYGAFSYAPGLPLCLCLWNGDYGSPSGALYIHHDVCCLGSQPLTEVTTKNGDYYGAAYHTLPFLRFRRARVIFSQAACIVLPILHVKVLVMVKNICRHRRHQY